MTQLSLLTLEKTTGIKNELCWIVVDQLVPHPRNPRRGQPDKLEAIATSMKEEGYRMEKPMLVRPFESGYQIIGGHTRHQAAIMAGLEKVLCVVEEMDDETAILRIGQDNLNDPFSWFSQCIYVAQNSVKDSKKGLSRTALITASTGKEGQSASLEAKRKGDVGEFLLRLEAESFNVERLLDPEVNLTSHLYAIHKAPEQYWQQLTELLIEKEWSVKQTETIVNAIKEVDIPEVLHGFLNPEYWVKKVIADATSDNPTNLQHSIGLWVTSAMEALEGEKALPTEKEVWQFGEDGLPYVKYIDLSAEFLEKLPSLIDGDKVPSQKKIDKIRKEVTDWANNCNQKYKLWKKAKDSEEERDRQRLEELERLNALRVKYAPTGFNADILSLSVKDFDNELLDAIITDPPYLISNGGFTLRDGKRASVDKNFEDTEGEAISPEEWIPHVAELLKPGGVIVATCTLHIYHRMVLAAKEAELLTEELQAIWHKPNAAPQLSPTTLQTNFEYIFVAFKPGDKSLTPRIEEYQARYEEYPSRIFSIPQCSGTERVGWHDTQKPLELYEKLITLFVPFDGRLLDPFAGSGTTAVAAKRLQRVAYWVEKSAEFYPKTEQRIESEKFAWEV
jgi:site-specific DNA-methyltransferase (adenine-specific)